MMVGASVPVDGAVCAGTCGAAGGSEEDGERGGWGARRMGTRRMGSEEDGERGGWGRGGWGVRRMGSEEDGDEEDGERGGWGARRMGSEEDGERGGWGARMRLSRQWCRATWSARSFCSPSARAPAPPLLMRGELQAEAAAASTQGGGARPDALGGVGRNGGAGEVMEGGAGGGCGGVDARVARAGGDRRLHHATHRGALSLAGAPSSKADVLRRRLHLLLARTARHRRFAVPLLPLGSAQQQQEQYTESAPTRFSLPFSHTSPFTFLALLLPCKSPAFLAPPHCPLFLAPGAADASAGAGGRHSGVAAEAASRGGLAGVPPGGATGGGAVPGGGAGPVRRRAHRRPPLRVGHSSLPTPHSIAMAHIAMAHIAMAHIAMAHIAMAHIAMAHIAMAHIGMAHIGMAHIGMAHIAMAHIAMAHIAMAHIAMAHIAMAHIGMAHIGMAHIAMAHIAMAHIAMAHIAMAHIAMAHIAMAHIAMAHIAMAHIAMAHIAMAHIAMAHIALHHPKTLQRLATVLGAYDALDEPPRLFLLIGDFCSPPSALASPHLHAHREAFSQLARVIGAHRRLKDKSLFVFVPGQADPGGYLLPLLPPLPSPALALFFCPRGLSSPCAVLPRPSLPRFFTDPITDALPSAVFSSNPSRLKFYSQELVVLRADLQRRMQRCAVLPPLKDTDPFTHVATTVVHQAHLSPLPLAAQPVFWDYDFTLHLFPAPHVLILADSSGQSSAVVNGITCINPGSFSLDGTFTAYYPASRSVEHCNV
ncbi:unnamed protein product [Closterium sp. NIES-65]|nr:unnamed protein product [Closterium sp. NIES-65]